MRYGGWKQVVNGWNFERKIRFFLSLAVVGTSVVILGVSTVSTMLSMTRQTRQMVNGQLVTLASNYDDKLEQYQTLAVAMTINENVQAYCGSESVGQEYEKEAGEVYQSLMDMLNFQKNMNFIAVVNGKNSDYVYKGNSSVVDARFDVAYQKDYEKSVKAKGDTSVRMSFGNQYFRTGNYTLTLYFPVYSSTKINQHKGMLVINMNDNLLEQLYYRNDPGMESEMFLMDTGGHMVSIGESKKIGQRVPYLERIQGNSGSFTNGKSLIHYQKVGKWNYYLVNEIPTYELYRGSLRTLVVSVFVILGMVVVTILFLRRMIRKFYRPINRVVSGMDHVAEGRLDIRIDPDKMDVDSRKLANGFNSMMDEINVLMEQVKMEQHQMEQIRLKELQSQIKPHFLYNTLECIHWQAVADGNREISTMVKALAQYYRACLSKGKEIITLKQELDHIRSYLIIQNMRYDNIIELDVEISAEYEEVQIPKMTLQPLIENAIYHGIRVKEGKKGQIMITIGKGDEGVWIYVADSGTGMSQEEVNEVNRSISEFDESFGYGVRNVHKRIELDFGPQYGLHYERNKHGGVTVCIHLPGDTEGRNKEVLSCIKH